MVNTFWEIAENHVMIIQAETVLRLQNLASVHVLWKVSITMNAMRHAKDAVMRIE